MQVRLTSDDIVLLELAAEGVGRSPAEFARRELMFAVKRVLMELHPGLPLADGLAAVRLDLALRREDDGLREEGPPDGQQAKQVEQAHLWDDPGGDEWWLYELDPLTLADSGP